MTILTLSSSRRATPTTRIIRVALDDIRFTFEAGQWARLGPVDREGQPYSIACSPAESRATGTLEFLIREEGSGKALAGMRRGDPVRVDGPHGRFHLTQPLDASEVLFVAGGTGIAPIRSMLMDLLERPTPPRCTLLYSARSSNEFAYAAELRRLAREERLTLVLTVTRGASPRWKGLIGRITAQKLRGLTTSREAIAFVCGPPGMVEEVKRTLEEEGLKRIRVEGQ